MKHKARFFGLVIVLTLIIIFIGLTANRSAEACGGLFCTTVPVDQQAERIIFDVNDNGTISAYVQINYTGSPDDFSWVVPVPNTPEIDVAEMATFDELSNLTQPIFIPPPMPDCVPMVVLESAMPSGMDTAGGRNGEVEVLSQGSVGPYDYSVITSSDYKALVNWLRDNSYRITEEMEPLVKVYTDEGMVFLAMKLSPDQGAQDIQPVKMTYKSEKPMIPLRLTAVAANPNMNVVTWILSDEIAYPVNYANPTIDDKDIRIFPFGGGPIVPLNNGNGSVVNPPNNYILLVDALVDKYEGRAFITEYAGRTAPLTDGVSDPLLKELLTDNRTLTRFFGRISPEEMTVDPMFDFDDDLPSISNVHDLTKLDPEDVYGCND